MATNVVLALPSLIDDAYIFLNSRWFLRSRYLDTISNRISELEYTSNSDRSLSSRIVPDNIYRFDLLIYIQRFKSLF